MPAQPISTAPQDGTHFLAWQKDEGWFECWWYVSATKNEAYWMNYPDNEPAPTRWLPLPELAE